MQGRVSNGEASSPASAVGEAADPSGDFEGRVVAGHGFIPEAGRPDPAPELGRMMEQVSRVASRSTTVLLCGETGTGKTRLARLIHEMSPRRHEPFLTVNCGALSASLIESEMFGHVRGAFTGADCDRAGKFADVGDGTLLLDDIDALSPELQAKLLRVVEERVFEPVGSNKSQPMTARLIAASNRELDREAAAGGFRSDLYYRLNVVGFRLPALRERPGAIPELACAFAAEFAARHGRDGLVLSPAALKSLGEYSWPGNVRELRKAIERAVALSEGDEIGVDDLPETLLFACDRRPAPNLLDWSKPGESLVQALRDAEVARILRALENQGNNRLRAAAELGISRMTLYKKLHKYGLMKGG